MSTALQQCAVELFVRDVLVPARARWAAGGESWTVKWSVAEIEEALRLLKLGSALGVFPPKPYEGIHGRIEDLGAGLADHGNASEGEEWVIERNLAALHSNALALEPGTEPARRALARARGLFRATALSASELGHGLAAEAIAQLRFGEPRACVDAIRAAAQVNELRWREQLVNALSQPASSLDPNLGAHGTQLAASMYHATEFLYSTGYVHDGREVSIVGQDGGVDPLHEAIGVSTGDLAHRLLYWRMPFGDEAFRVHFLDALGWSGKLLYRHGVVGHGDSGEGSDDRFAEALVDRVGRAANIWSRAFIAAYATAGQSEEDGQAGAAAAAS